MADPTRPAPSLESLGDLGRSEGLRRARVLPAGLRAYALGEALPWLDGGDRQRAAAWLIRRAGRGEGLEGVSALAARVGSMVFGGVSVPSGQEALFQLARRWHAVPDGLRGAALAAAGPARWVRAIDRASMLEDPQSRAGAAELAGLVASRLGSLAALERVTPLLADADKGVAMAAERALVRATGRAAELGLEPAPALEDEGEPLEPVTVGGVEGVVAQAVIGFEEHRRFGVLLAALALLTEAGTSAGRRGIGTPLATWLAERPTSAHGALRTVLRKADLALARQRALSWIVMDHLAQAASDRLSRAQTPAEHEAVLDRVFLTRRRLRAARVAGMQARPKLRQTAAGLTGDELGTPPLDWPEACPVPGEATIERLSTTARAGLAEWLAALQIDRVTRARVLAPRLADDEPRVRLSLALHGPPNLIEDLAYDAHPAIARSAVLVMSRLGEPLEATPAATQPVEAWQARLHQHPDATVRMIGRQELARAGKLGAGPLAACSARAALVRTDSKAAWLLAAIEAGGAEERIEAITLARRLGLPASHSGLRDALLAALMVAGPTGGLALEDDRQRVAATAVRALATAPGREVTRAIEAACRYPAPRVRANAVEAMDDRRRRSLMDEGHERFVEMAVALSGDEHQRVRANAVRAGLIGMEGKPVKAARQACESALRSMLGDERAPHRISGLWVAGRVLRRGPELSLGRRWTELAAVIADMARHDADSGARGRASACLGSLEAEARQRWQRGARRADGAQSKREEGAVA